MHLALALLQENLSTGSAASVLAASFAIFAVVAVVVLAIYLIPFWFICKRAGFSPWLTLLNIIPLGNLILIYVLAFAEWRQQPANTSQIAPQ